MVKELATFVGQSRMLLVEGLVELFDEVSSSGESRWVSLEAPTGWGKTRVGKRLYAELAARQKPPAYWPASLGEVSRGEHKVVAPKGKRQEGSLPEFLWWGIACSSDEHFRAPALREGVSELASHSQYVSIACRKNRPIGEKAIDRVRSEAWDFMKAGAMEGFGAVVGTLGVALPGMGLAVLAGRKMASAVKSHRADRQTVGDESEIGASSRGLVEELTEQFREIGRAKFPVLVFVEDVHFADEALLSALNAMLRRVSHLLVVTTTWPGKVDENPDLSRLARELGDRVVRVGDRRPAGPPFPDRAGLMELEEDACKAIVREHYPHADPETVTLLVDRYRNPGALDLVCDMVGFKQSFGERGDLYIAPENIRVLPKATSDLYKQYWDQLPVSQKLRYAVAAAISPAAIDPDEGAGYHTWSAPVLHDVIRRLNVQSYADLHDAIEASTDAYGWVMNVDEYLRRWSEIDQHQIAANAGSELLETYLIAREQILTAVANVVLSGASPSSHAARTVIALYAANHIKDGAPVIKAVAMALDDLGYDDTAIQERVRLYGHYLELAESTSIDELTDLDVHFNGIDAIAASGRYTRAVDGYRCLHTRTLDVHGAKHRRTLKTLHYLAENLCQVGQGLEAIKTFEHACAGLSELVGEDHPDTLSAFSGLAEALEWVGRGDEAVNILERVLESRIRVLGDGHPDTSASRHHLAHALTLEGRSLEAIGVFERVLADRADALGEDHPETLAARIDLAQQLAKTGRVDAVETLEKVLADRVRVLGEDHLDTWEARDHLAKAYEFTGRWDKAVALFEQIAIDRVRVLGEDHPDTLDAKCRLAHELPVARRDDEVLDLLKQVLEARTRVLGSDHPDTIDTRADVAFQLFLEERLEEALDEFKQVVAARKRVLGEDHPDTLRARGEIARLWSQMGRLDDAIDLYDQLVVEAAQVLGTGHDIKYYYLDMKAEALQNAGRIEDAIAVYRHSIRDRVETLGPYHPETMEAHDQLAYTLSKAGELDEAISILRRILDDRIAVHGEHHESVSSTRRGLAPTLVDAGRYSEAITVYEQIVDDETRMYGEEAAMTLNARRILGSVLRDAGETDEAIAVLEHTLEDCKRVLGDEDFETGMVQDELARALGRGGRVEDAITLYGQILADRTRVLGADHPDTLRSHEHLALALYKGGRVEDAIASYEQVHSERIRVLGADHPDTLMSRTGLGVVLYKGGRVEDAIVILKQVLDDQIRVLGADHPDTLMSRNSLAAASQGGVD